MTYQEARAAADKADSAHKAACDAMRATEARLAADMGIQPRGAMNLLSDAIRTHPDYRAAWARERVAFEALRKANTRLVRGFPKELAADRLAARKQRMART